MENEESPRLDHLHTIFVDTSIDTHIAIAVSIYDTISDVKVKIRAEHAVCFQDIGEISIQAIKVRRRGFFYNLSDSMYVFNAFDGVKGCWCVSIDVVPTCAAKNQKAFIMNQNNAMKKWLDQDQNEVIPSTSIGHENQKLVDASLKELPVKDGSFLQNTSTNPAQIVLVRSIDDSTRVDRNAKTIDCVKIDETHLHEGAMILRSDPEKNSGSNGQEGDNPIVLSVDYENRPALLIDEETNSRRKNDCEKLAIEVNGAMPCIAHTHKTISGNKSKKSLLPDKLLESQSQHDHVEKKRGKKLKDAFHEEHQGNKLGRREDIDESNKSTNIPMETSYDGKTENLAAKGSLNKLPHENTISFQNPAVEKHTKKRRKSSKSHEEAFLTLPSATIESESLQVTAGRQNLGKAAKALIFSGTHSTARNIDESLPNDDGDRSTAHDNATFSEVSNQKEIGHLMKTNKEPLEEQVLRVNSEVQSKQYMNSGLETNDNTENTASLQSLSVEKQTKKRRRKSSKSYAETHLSMPSETLFVRSPQATADPPDSGKVANDSSIFSEKLSTQLNFEASVRNDESYTSTACDTTSFLEVSNQKEIKHSTELSKELLKEQSMQVNPEDQSKRHVNPGQVNNADISLKESNEAKNSSQVASESPTKLYCSTGSKIFEPKEANDHKKSKRRKKSKVESSKVCEPSKPNGNKDFIDSGSGQVSLNDAQNESNDVEHIKQVYLKENRSHGADTLTKISSSSKKALNQDEVFELNSINPSVSTPHVLTDVSHTSVVEQATEIGIPSQTYEVQPKPRNSKRKSKSKLSNIESRESSDVMLPKLNDEVTEYNENKGSDPSKVPNLSNQNTELHHIDLKVAVPLSDENSLKLIEVPQMNPFDPSSCKIQNLREQSNAKTIIKGHETQHDALVAPTKSKRERKRSKKEILEAPVIPEMSERRPDDSAMSFNGYFIMNEGKHSPAVQAVNLPPGKSETEKKRNTSKKTHINQPDLDSQSNLAQPSSHKQHIVQEQDANNNTNDTVPDTATKNSNAVNARKSRSSKQSSKQVSSIGRIESDSSLLQASEKHSHGKKLQNNAPQLYLQPSKSGDSKQGKAAADGMDKTRSVALDHCIDDMASKGGVQLMDINSSTISNTVVNAKGSNNFEVSMSDRKNTEAASSDSTEYIHPKTRFRVVRKIPSIQSKKSKDNSDPGKTLLTSSDRIFSDASETSSDSENNPKMKADINTTLDDLPLSGDSDNYLVEDDTNASVSVGTHSGADSDDEQNAENSKKTGGKSKNHSRNDAPTQKTPLSTILKSSSRYRKAKSSASQSEFPDEENQPVDVVLETQPESDALTQ